MTLFPHHRTTPAFVCDPPKDDWSALMSRHPNVLIHGPHDATDALVDALTPYLRLPIHYATGEAFPLLPSTRGTLILDDVEALDSHQQQTLLGWLDDCADTEMQVISISPTALHTHVQDGTFLNVLYYRLNVIYLEVSATCTQA